MLIKKSRNRNRIYPHTHTETGKMPHHRAGKQNGYRTNCVEIDGCRTQRGLTKWGISRDRRTLSYDKIEDGMEDVDTSSCREERRRERGRGKKWKREGQGKGC